jgi:hypothetical protein
VIVVIGLFVFENQSSNKYKSNIKTAYNNQSKDISLVYDTITLPVFSENNSTSSQDEENYNTVKSLISSAKKSTGTLSNENKFTEIPLLTSIGSIKKSKDTKNKVSDYITQSNKFLDSYSQLNEYIHQLGNIGNNQLPDFANSLQQFSSITSVNDYQASIDASSLQLTKLLDALKALKPTSDVQGVNSKLISGLESIQADLQGISKALKNNNSKSLETNALKLIVDGQDFEKLSSIDFASLIENDNSSIKTQIANLKSKNPISNLNN